MALVDHLDAVVAQPLAPAAGADALLDQPAQLVVEGRPGELLGRVASIDMAGSFALIPIGYGRAMAYVKPWVKGWWEFGKSSASFADLLVDPASPRA